VCLHQFADSLPVCYAAGMNTNVKLVVTLQEWVHDLCCCSMVPSLICLYGRMENTDDSVPFLQKYAYVSQVINHSWGHLTVRWRIELTCPNLTTACSCRVRLSTVLCTCRSYGGAKLPYAVSSHFKRFHIYKKHKFFFGSHLKSADENFRWNHTRPHSCDAILERHHEKCNYNHYCYHESGSSNVTIMGIKAVREQGWPSKDLCLIRKTKCR
jgi:hypothetical protein